MHDAWNSVLSVLEPRLCGAMTSLDVAEEKHYMRVRQLDFQISSR